MNSALPTRPNRIEALPYGLVRRPAWFHPSRKTMSLRVGFAREACERVTANQPPSPGTQNKTAARMDRR